MTMPVDKHVGRRIRRRRWIIGMTQQALAERLGVRLQQIQRYEAGFSPVPASGLRDIAGTLGVAVAFFFEELDSANLPIPEGGAKASQIQELQELEAFFQTLSETQRQRLLDMARTLEETDAPAEENAASGRRDRRSTRRPALPQGRSKRPS